MERSLVQQWSARGVMRSHGGDGLREVQIVRDGRASGKVALDLQSGCPGSTVVGPSALSVRVWRPAGREGVLAGACDLRGADRGPDRNGASSAKFGILEPAAHLQHAGMRRRLCPVKDKSRDLSVPIAPSQGGGSSDGRIFKESPAIGAVVRPAASPEHPVETSIVRAFDATMPPRKSKASAISSRSPTLEGVSSALPGSGAPSCRSLPTRAYLSGLLTKISQKRWFFRIMAADMLMRLQAYIESSLTPD